MAQVSVLSFEHVQGPHYVLALPEAPPRGTPVVGSTRFGLSVGRLAEANLTLAAEPPELEQARPANDADLAQAAENATLAAGYLDRCRELVGSHNLPMKLVRPFLSLDQRQFTIFFTAPCRVDFRGLLRDLVRLTTSAIRLEQIGDRDCARLLGGLGRCGRECCCAAWMHRFEPVSMVHAKEQGLAPQPAQLTGVCGKLRCCLRFESDQPAERHELIRLSPRRPTKTATRHLWEWQDEHAE